MDYHGLSWTIMDYHRLSWTINTEIGNIEMDVSVIDDIKVMMNQLLMEVPCDPNCKYLSVGPLSKLSLSVSLSLSLSLSVYLSISVFLPLSI